MVQNGSDSECSFPRCPETEITGLTHSRCANCWGTSVWVKPGGYFAPKDKGGGGGNNGQGGQHSGTVVKTEQ